MRALEVIELVCCVAVVSAVTACGGGTPPPAPTGPPAAGDAISGSEPMGWDQPASNASELGTYRYAVYLDDARREAMDVSCTAAASGLFACTCKLPPMSSGAHTLQVAAFVQDGDAIAESPRSAAVRVTIR